jgi:CHAD domain-containing protein
VQRVVRRARKRIDRWPLEGVRFRSFVDGIAKTYRDGRRLMSAATDLKTDECHHEWRKQAKYLRHQSEILCPILPEAMSVLIGQAHELADLLGDDHDLAVMTHVLTTELRDAVERRERKALLGLIGERRATLQKHAKQLGRKLFADKPKAFRRRVREYLDAWA